MAVDKKGLGKSQREFRDAFRKKIRKHTFVQFGASFLVLLAGVTFLIMYAIGMYKVKGDGMGTEAPDGSHVVVNKLAYLANTPERGDVVVTKGGRIYRIVGMPGETISFNGGFVYADGIMLNETNYLKGTGKNLATTYSNETYQIPEGEYMVLCDNRDCFLDSRENGLYITIKEIAGKTFWVF